MFQKEPAEEDKVNANQGGRLPPARAGVNLEEHNKEIRAEAISTYKNINKGIELKAELVKDKGRLQQAIDMTPESQTKSNEYLANRINQIKIEKALPTITDNLLTGEILKEPLRDFAVQKNYGEVAALLKLIGKYEVPKDPRLSPEDLTLLNQITSKPWYNASSKLDAQVLSCIFDLSNNTKVSKDSLISLINSESLATLNPNDQKMVLNLAVNLGEESIKNLKLLLNEKIDGKCALLNADFTATEGKPGKTLLENLTTFLQSDLKAINEYRPIVTLEEKKEETKKKEKIISEFIKEIATFSDIQQENRGTCAPTTLHHYMSWMKPSELTRLYSNLLIEGNCYTYGGDLIKLVKDSIHDDKTNRSLSERVITSSLLNDAVKRKSDDRLNYSNEKDAFIAPFLGNVRSTYQTPEEFIHTCESVLWTMKTKISPTEENKKELIPKAIEILNTLDPKTTNPEFTAIAVRWPSFGANEDPNQVGTHAILALGIVEDQSRTGRKKNSESRLFFRNPHGASSDPKGTYINKYIRVENPEEGEYSLPLKAIEAGGEYELRLLLKK